MVLPTGSPRICAKGDFSGQVAVVSAAKTDENIINFRSFYLGFFVKFIAYKRVSKATAQFAKIRHEFIIQTWLCVGIDIEQNVAVMGLYFIIKAKDFRPRASFQILLVLIAYIIMVNLWKTTHRQDFPSETILQRKV